MSDERNKHPFRDIFETIANQEFTPVQITALEDLAYILSLEAKSSKTNIAFLMDEKSYIKMAQAIQAEFELAIVKETIRRRKQEDPNYIAAMSEAKQILSPIYQQGELDEKTVNDVLDEVRIARNKVNNSQKAE